MLKNNIFFLENLIKLVPLSIKQILVYKENYIISLNSNINLINFFKFFKIHMNFQQLADITAIDFLKNKSRFTLVYNVLNLDKNFRIILKYDINSNIFDKKIINKSKLNYSQEMDLIYNSISLNNIYKSSNWLEREVWDMYGIIFWGNKDLRRILTDYGFKGHPLRKDFPLVGFLEIMFDLSSKTLKYTKLELSQEFRKYKFVSAWNQTK